MLKLVQVVNTAPGTATGGGSSRALALDQFVDAQGGARIMVQDSAWLRSRVRRLMRPVSLVREIARSGPDILVFRYPGFPFFWSTRRNLDLARSLVFLLLLKRVVRLRGCHVIVDMLDLVRYPSPNPDLALGVSDRLLGYLERCLFAAADELWACSEAIRHHLVETYTLPEENVRIVLNGSFRDDGPGAGVPEAISGESFNFFYAGDLARGWRGAEIMLDAFVAKITDGSARLILCGTNGEWIAGCYPDSRIVNLGPLLAQEVSAVGRMCHVGLIPQPECGYYHLAFPAKLGLYLALGLPVVTSCAKEAADFVQGHGLGVVASAEAFGEGMRDIMADRGMLQRYRQAAAELSEAFYWDNIYGSALAEFKARISGCATEAGR